MPLDILRTEQLRVLRAHKVGYFIIIISSLENSRTEQFYLFTLRGKPCSSCSTLLTHPAIIQFTSLFFIFFSFFSFLRLLVYLYSFILNVSPSFFRYKQVFILLELSTTVHDFFSLFFFISFFFVSFIRSLFTFYF